jgi:hypothetical protein
MNLPAARSLTFQGSSGSPAPCADSAQCDSGRVLPNETLSTYTRLTFRPARPPAVIVRAWATLSPQMARELLI